MRKKTMSTFALASVLTLTLAGCVADESETGGDEEAEGTSESEAAISSVDEIVIALVPSNDIDNIVESAEPLAEALSEALDGFPVRAEETQDYLGAITAMQTGDAQVVMSGPVGMIQAEEQADAVPITQSIRYGSDVYVTQWFTNDPDTYCMDEPVDVPDEEGNSMLFCNGTDEAEPGAVGTEALEEIEEGTTVSYVDQGSASGYYYPATQLNDLLGFAPGEGDIDEQFAGSHDNSVLNVYNDNATIGTSFDDARENVVAENPDVGEEVVVFAWAGPIPNDGIVVSGDFTEEEQQVLTDAWLAVAEDEEGLAALDEVYEIEGMVEADQEALDGARQVYNDFGDE